MSSFTNQILNKDTKVLENVVNLCQNKNFDEIKTQLLNFEPSFIESFYYYLLINQSVPEHLQILNFNEIVKRLMSFGSENKEIQPIIWKLFALISSRTENLGEKLNLLFVPLNEQQASITHLNVLKIILESFCSEKPDGEKCLPNVINFLQNQLSENSNSYSLKLLSLDCLEIIFKSFTNDHERHRILIEIWENSLRKSGNLENLYIIGHLLEHYIWKDKFLIEDAEFGRMIYDGCKYREDNFIKKHAVYALKLMFAKGLTMTNDYIWIRDIDNLDNSSSWAIFFNVLDSLDQNQSHLVIPALQMIEKIDVNFRKQWIILLLDISIRSDNTLIRSWTIKYTLNKIKLVPADMFDKNASDYIDIFKQTLGKFLLSADNTEDYIAYQILVEQFFSQIPFQMFSTNDTMDPYTVYTLASTYFRNVTIDHAIKDPKNFKSTFHNLLLTISNCSKRKIRDHLQVPLFNFLNKIQTSLSNKKILFWLQEIFSIYKEKTEFFRYAGRAVELDELITLKKTEHFLTHFFIQTKLTFVVGDSKHILKRLKEFRLFTALSVLITPENRDYMEFLDDFLRLQFKSQNCYDYTEALSRMVLLCSEYCSKMAELASKRLSNPSNDLKSSEIFMSILILRHTEQHIHISINYSDLTKYLKIFRDETFSNKNRRLFSTEFYRNLCSYLTDNLKWVSKLKISSNLSFTMPCEYDDIDFNSLIKMCKEFVELYGEDIVECTLLLYREIQELNFRVHNKLDNITESSVEYFDLCLTEIMLMRKNEMFYRYLELYLEITLSVQLRKCIFSNNRWRSEVIEPNFNRLLSESPKISQLANIYYAVLFLSTEYRILIKWNRLEDVLVEGLLFGENLGREHFEEQKFYQIINKDLDDNLNKNHGTHINRNIYVRVHCIEFILNHLGGEQDLLNKLTNTLIQKSMHLGRSKPRYYANSQHHRIKLRIVQSLAFITNMTKEYNHLFWKTILTENNQLNITYLLELIVSQTIDRKNLIDLLKDQNNFKSPNTIQSLLVIAYLKCRKDDDKELCATIIEHMFQWTMSQHFMTRLYAQITMLKLIESFGSEKSSEHKIIYNSIVNSLLHGSNTAEQNIEKLKNDFRYNLIGPKNMLSISNIFYHIPRITEMADDEWKQFKCLKKESDLLNNCNQSWIKPNKNIVVNEMEIGSGIENIQKKILPIKESIPQTLPTINTRLLIAENDTSLDTDANLNGLIVVASLVSRFPNLGGLARSCEIFGVRKYVVDSLKHADNLEFQTLSMSAEKWLPIAEVKSFQLSDYLSYMKKNGYTIVGAEQTAKSCQITDVKFPKKTIVLLGHEKEGIPANLLSLLDIPVEIPQFGVVRSLNVHVTGAIFMWEYVKQHFIK